MGLQIKAAISKLNNFQGFTLVEMMIAITIIAISMLGLASVTITAMQANHVNEVRNGAIRVTSQYVADLSGKPLSAITSETVDIPLALKGGNQKYTLNATVTAVAHELIRIAITVTYTVRGVSYSHNSVSFRQLAE